MPFVGCCRALVACLCLLSMLQYAICDSLCVELTVRVHLGVDKLEVDCSGLRLSGKPSTQ
jgi:hypothetical protein